MNEPRRAHWDAVYRDKREAQTSWFRPHLDESLRLIEALALQDDAPLLDVGGGRATLVDDLLARDFRDVSVLDIAETALADARHRLGARAADVHWIVGDVTDVVLPTARYALWHDRAVFHFLTEAVERDRYIAATTRAVRPDGYAVIATFAADGPERCSDLPVCRYDAGALAMMFAASFEFVTSSRDLHRTPADREQAFIYVVLRRRRTRTA